MMKCCECDKPIKETIFVLSWKQSPIHPTQCNFYCSFDCLTKWVLWNVERKEAEEILEGKYSSL